MPPLLADFIHARAYKPICAKLLTLPRYLAGCFVLPCAAALCCRRCRWLRLCWLAVQAAIAAAYFAVYLRHGPVY